MGTPRSPARGSWSFLAETSIQVFELEASRQRVQSEAPSSSALPEPSGPLAAQALPLHLSSQRASWSPRLCGAALPAHQPSVSLLPSAFSPAVPPPRPPRFSFSFLSGRCLPSPPAQVPFGPLTPLSLCCGCSHTTPASHALNFHLCLVLQLGSTTGRPPAPFWWIRSYRGREGLAPALKASTRSAFRPTIWDSELLG